jgi:hypothetical protein
MTTDAGAQVVEQNAYDGYDRLVRQQKFDSAGTQSAPKQTTYQKAYDETKAKLVGDGGGQGQEYIIGCNSTETWIFQAGRRGTCG